MRLKAGQLRVLVDTTVQIESNRDRRRAVWWRVPRSSSHAGVGTHLRGQVFRIHAGLQADLFNPPVRTPVTGTVRQIMLVTGRVEDRSADSSVPWELMEVRTSPSSFARLEDGLLILLAI